MEADFFNWFGTDSFSNVNVREVYFSTRGLRIKNLKVPLKLEKNIVTIADKGKIKEEAMTDVYL